jgi:hypothetical protein
MKLAQLNPPKFKAVGMRTRIADPDALIINTCGKNDTSEKGNALSWVWSNPTNRAIMHQYEDVQAVSVECLWQGMKMVAGQTKPDPEILGGNWRKAKGKKPVGAYAGPNKPLITTPGAARRTIYVPAFRNLIEHWLADAEVRGWLDAARNHKGTVYLRDFDTGQGIDRNGPMSHAWLFSVWLNTGSWPV